MPDTFVGDSMAYRGGRGSATEYQSSAEDKGTDRMVRLGGRKRTVFGNGVSDGATRVSTEPVRGKSS